MKKLLYLTDLYYEAKGRRYCDEDLYLTGRLKDRFDFQFSGINHRLSGGKTYSSPTQ